MMDADTSTSKYKFCNYTQHFIMKTLFSEQFDFRKYLAFEFKLRFGCAIVQNAEQLNYVH